MALIDKKILNPIRYHQDNANTVIGQASTMKALFDQGAEDLRVKLNGVIDELLATTGAQQIGIDPARGLGNTLADALTNIKNYMNLGASGISATTIGTGSGNNVQSQLEWLLLQIQNVVLNQIPDGTVTMDKLSTTLADLINGHTTQLAQKATSHASKFIGKLESGKNATVVFLGDSVTEQNGTTNGQPNHVGLLTTWLENKYPGKVTVVNAGISGNSISQMLSRLNKDVLIHNPDLVIISSGINDAIGTNAITIEKFIYDYNVLIQAIIAFNHADIVLRTSNMLIAPSSNEIMFPYIQATRSIAVRYNLGLYDLYSEIQKDVANKTISLTIPGFMNDGIHPNQNGHQYIYEKFLPYFQQTIYAVKPINTHKIISGRDGFRVMNTGAVESNNINAIGGKLLAFSVPARAIETEFYGSNFSIFYTGSPSSGQFKVYIDGVEQPIVDTYNPTVLYGRHEDYFINSGNHIVKIEVQSTKNVDSTGTLIMIESIVFEQETVLNDITRRFSLAEMYQTSTINLTPSTDNMFIFNSVTDNSDIIDTNLGTGEITIKKSGLYDILFTHRITCDVGTLTLTKMWENGVAKKTNYHNTPSGTGTKTSTIDFVDCLELAVGDVIKFSILPSGVSPTTTGAVARLKRNNL